MLVGVDIARRLHIALESIHSGGLAWKNEQLGRELGSLEDFLIPATGLLFFLQSLGIQNTRNWNNDTRNRPETSGIPSFHRGGIFGSALCDTGSEEEL